VDLDRLLGELRATDQLPSGAIAAASGEPGSSTSHYADSIYRRFFKTGIMVALSAGAVWGAFLLWRIALSGSFTAISIHDINAHGHAQILGWVGLFVMGFAYQAFPRMRHTTLWRPGLALLTFYLMLVGIVARSVGEPLSNVPGMRLLAMAGATCELVAAGLFPLVIIRTIQRSGRGLAWVDGYVVAALAFFFIQAAYEWGLLLATTGATTHAHLLALIAAWQASLRDIQIHGFALLMILGVGIRMFPPLFELPAHSPRLVRVCLFLLLAGVVGEVGSFLLMHQTGNRAWTGPMYLSMLALAGASFALTWRWIPGKHVGEPDRSRKFVQAAALWLNISMLMLVLAPLYMYVLLPHAPWLSASGARSVTIGFSHAYYGAVRHAVTVGFISLMILGMAAKVVPTLNGVDIRLLRRLWLPFILVNIGCTLRVSLQIATDFTATAYPLVGISGLLEVAGLAIWGVHLWRIMNGWVPAAERETAPVRPTHITADDFPGRVVEWFPATLDVFLRHGLTPLANPLLRRTLGRGVTLRTAAAMRGIVLADLLRELNLAAYPAVGMVPAAVGMAPATPSGPRAEVTAPTAQPA